MKIFVPNSDSYSCIEVINHYTLRAYEDTPVVGSSVNFRDYFIDSNYLFKDGSEVIEISPICISTDNLTSDVFYRSDFDKILLITFILLILLFWFPYKIISRLFGRWLKI